MNQPTDDEIAIVEEHIKALASEETNNWDVTKNLTRIAKAKLRFFGLGEWQRCPCYPPTDTIHGCGTPACAEQIQQDGICHCNLYMRKQ